MSDHHDHELPCRGGSGKYNVLFVDDEELVLKSLERAFRREDFNLLTASSGTLALEILKKKEIQVLVTDYRMPEMDGIELAEKVAEINPDIIRIILSGYSEASTIIEAINRGSIYKFLTKPWHSETLKMNIKLAIERYEMSCENTKLNEQLLSLNDELQAMNSSLEDKVEERTIELREVRDGLKDTISATISMLSHIMDVHNIDLSGHGQRVSLHCRKLGKALHLPEEEYEQLERAAMLHDIGKIFISQKTLSKLPEQYDELDQRYMTLHTLEGYHILNRIPGFEHVALIVRHHHENYDGTGYPDGLSRKQIPLGARIIMVSDSYERYRYSLHLSREEICNRMRAEAGVYLDPELTELFLSEIIPKLGELDDKIQIPLISAIPGLKLTAPIIDSNGTEICKSYTVLDRNIISDMLSNNALDMTETMITIESPEIINNTKVMNYYI